MIFFRDGQLLFGAVTQLKLRTEVENSTLIPRAINQERNLILTCGFRGKFGNALDYQFQ